MLRIQAMLFRLCLAAIAVATTRAEFYDTFTGIQISEAKYRQYEVFNLVPYCAIEVKECDERERRRIDCSCNNLHYPNRGAMLTPYRRMLPPSFGPGFTHRRSSSGAPLPSARAVRVAIMTDGRVADERFTILVTNGEGAMLTPYRRMLPPSFGPGFTHRRSSSGAPLPSARAVRVAIMTDGRVADERFTILVTNGLLAITGDVTSVHDTANYVGITTTCCAPGGEEDPRCMPIPVADDDVHLRRSSIRCLNLTRAITYQDLGCVNRSVPLERVNTSPPLLDLSILYGDDELRGRLAREGRGGRLRSDTINGKEWPPTGGYACLANQNQRGETRCHNTPALSTNILIGPNVLSIWLFRQHNAIAKALEDLNPCWDDERLYFEAREINIAYVNQMWFYEMMPAILGFDYLLKNKVIYDTWGHVDDYDPKLEPRVAIEYVIGTRYFHSMQEGRLKTYDKTGKLLSQLNTVELTLRTGILPLNRTIEGLTQGFFRQATAAADHLIDPDMGERVLGGFQTASDVMSSDMMKGRDAGLPPYNKYRKACHLPVAKDFEDLKKWMPLEQVEAMQLNYESVEDIDIMAGILSENAMEGAAVGPVLACIMADQLLYWRRSDRFWFENTAHPFAFRPEQLYEIRKMSMARLICDTGDDVDAIQQHAFIIPGPGNEIKDCKFPPKPSLEPWKDDSCKIQIVPQTKKTYDNSYDKSYDKSNDKSYDNSYDKSYDNSYDKSYDKSNDKSYDKSYTNSYDKSMRQSPFVLVGKRG